MPESDKNGILCVDKPEGYTSFDVVARLRGILHTRRIGHAGTLDPMATGVLPVFVGHATKAVDLAPDHNKRYTALLRLGLTTDTLDITGTVLTQCPVPEVPEEEMIRVLGRFAGEIEQVPPMYSAVRINGKKLYELARAGQTVERKARRVTIYDIRLIGRPEPSDYEIEVFCSKGTYIRSLCDDIGRALGCGAALAALRRTQACGFTLMDCRTLEEIQQSAQDGTLSLLPVEQVFSTLPAVTLLEQKPFINGAVVKGLVPSQEEVRVYNSEGNFLGLGKAGREGLRAKKLFFFPDNPAR